MKATVVPNRNAIFASILYGYALSTSIREDVDVEIALGVHSGDHAIYPDCRPEFYESIGESFAMGNWDSERVSFNLPYIDGDKTIILRDALISCQKLGLDFDTVFANTNTSYNPDEEGRSSGKSGADVERILAFHEIGRKDPVEYIDSWEVVLSGALKAQLRHYVMKENGTVVVSRFEVFVVFTSKWSLCAVFFHNIVTQLGSRFWRVKGIRKMAKESL